MIDLLERISMGLCGLVVVLVGAGYFLVGMRSSIPPELLVEVPAYDITQAVNQGTPAALPGVSPDRAQMLAQSVDMPKIRENLRKNGVNAGRIESTLKPIPPATYEYVRSEANWTPELRKYKSQLVPGSTSRLQITEGVNENTVLYKLGFRDGDVIELLDGESVEFSEQSMLRYREMFYDAVDRIQSGGSISVTVTRRGKPVNLLFTLDGIQGG